MLKIHWLKNRQVVRAIDAKWTIDIIEIARHADELQAQYAAEDWEIVNESDVQIFTRARWRELSYLSFKTV